jgi:hypothetical protein
MTLNAYAESRYAECHNKVYYVECNYAECHFSEYGNGCVEGATNIKNVT